MIRRPLNARFKEPVLKGIKTTTMRENAWPVGVPIMLYCWSGKPYRSKQEEVAVVVVEQVLEVTIYRDADGRMRYLYPLPPRYFRALWECEGFASQADMDDWFRALVKPGAAIRRQLMQFRLLKQGGGL